MLFKEYQSKPIVRKAYQVQESDTVQYWPDGTAQIGEVQFTAAEEVQVGGYIVHLNENDIYYCNEAVFKERNVT